MPALAHQARPALGLSPTVVYPLPTPNSPSHVLPPPTPSSSSTDRALLDLVPSAPTPAPEVTTVPTDGSGGLVLYKDDAEEARGVRLQKRQTVVQVVVVTVVTLLAQTPAATPTVVTLTVPPPQNTVVAQGGWPVINPGSAAACWGDYACNSVCSNFQQNGWYSGCIDAACTQCRCQIIEPSMCDGTAYTNSSYYVNQAPTTVTVYSPYATPYYGGGTAGVVTVWVAGTAGAFGGLKATLRTAAVMLGGLWLMKMV